MKNIEIFAGYGGEGKAQWSSYSVIMVLRDGGGHEIKEVTTSRRAQITTYIACF